MISKTETEYLNVVDPSRVVVVVLGGGRGSRLFPLTRDRAKPAVGFGGTYRLVDVVLTNCLRSGFGKIFLLTQFNSFSLNRHIWQTYSRELPRDSFIEVVAAEQTPEKRDWFQGTADAVRRSLRYILYHRPRYVLVLSADQVYSMDYRSLLFAHQTRSSDITVAARFTEPDAVHGLGIIKIDTKLHVVGFREKPRDARAVDGFKLSRPPAGIQVPQARPFLGSMGIYLFNTRSLEEALDGKETDFGHGIIPHAAKTHHMNCFPFDGYWEDVGTIEAFYRANMDWRAGRGISGMFNEGNAIITHERHLPPSRVDGAEIRESIIADGCHIAARSIRGSIIGLRSRLGLGCTIQDAILMGNDAHYGPEPFEIGANCFIRRAIIDKNVVIGDNSIIDGTEDRIDSDGDGDDHVVRSGIVVVPRGTVLPPGTRIVASPSKRDPAHL